MSLFQGIHNSVASLPYPSFLESSKKNRIYEQSLSRDVTPVRVGTTEVPAESRPRAALLGCNLQRPAAAEFWRENKEGKGRGSARDGRRALKHYTGWPGDIYIKTKGNEEAGLSGGSEFQP